MFSTRVCDCYCKNQASILTINLFAFSNQSRIVSSSLSIKGQDKYSLEILKQAPLLLQLYTKKQLQQIMWKTLESQSSMLTTPAFNKTCKRLLKVRALDIYQDKSQIECYNICKQYKDQFANIEAIGQN